MLLCTKSFFFKLDLRKREFLALDLFDFERTRKKTSLWVFRHLHSFYHYASSWNKQDAYMLALFE